MTDPQLTEIVVLLDRSGSMSTIQRPMVQGFADFMKAQRSEPGACVVSLYQFDNEWEMVFEGCPVAEVGPLVLIPRSMTALLDAMAFTIIAVGNRLQHTPEAKRPGKVVVLVITDGLENASVLYGREQVAQMVEHQKQAYDWQFAFLGANMDAVGEAKGVGVGKAQALNFQASAQGVGAMYTSAARAVSKYRKQGPGGSGLTFEAPEADKEQEP